MDSTLLSSFAASSAFAIIATSSFAFGGHHIAFAACFEVSLGRMTCNRFKVVKFVLDLEMKLNRWRIEHFWVRFSIHFVLLFATVLRG